MSEILTTPCGEIRGTTCQWEGVTAFKGIRYATAGRWEYPQIVRSWEGIYEATEYGHCSYQMGAFQDEGQTKSAKKLFYYNEFRKGENFTYDDDCLFLNIWKPTDATEESKLPVIVYIHGNLYTQGCGHEKYMDGPVWPTKGVIAVTLNYRLGPMGFMCLPELKAEAGHTGNYGLFDQVTALEWIQKNISAFGGDPANVTIMGHATGAMCVQYLCLSPVTEGLFAKAVMTGGGGVNMMLNNKEKASDRYKFWGKIGREAGCKNVEDLRALPIETIFETWQKVRGKMGGKGTSSSPCIDGALIVETNLEATIRRVQREIPYMIGSNSEGEAAYSLHGMAIDWCRSQAEQGKEPSYCWFFDRAVPGDKYGAWSGSELWYFFGTLKNSWRPFTEKDYELSEQMVTALCNFAKNGNPSGDGYPEWKPVTAKEHKSMCFGEKETYFGKPNRLKLIKSTLFGKEIGK